jgi:hypothetical protein
MFDKKFSSFSEEHLMGPSMSVCLSVVFHHIVTTIMVNTLLQQLPWVQFHNDLEQRFCNNDQKSHCCNNDLGLLLDGHLLGCSTVTTRCYNPEDSHLPSHCHENLQSYLDRTVATIVLNHILQQLPWIILLLFVPLLHLFSWLPCWGPVMWHWEGLWNFSVLQGVYISNLVSLCVQDTVSW